MKKTIPKLLIIFAVLVVVGALGVVVIQFDTVIDTLNTQAPWSYADKAINPPPKPPTLEEAQALYGAARKEIASHTPTASSISLSTELLWNVDHQAEMTKVLHNGQPVFQMLRKQNRNAELDIVSSLAPTVDKVNLLSIKDIDGMSFFSSRKAYFKDEFSKKITVIKTTPWRYAVRVVAESTGETTKKTGYIYFVFDKDQWKYNTEVWGN